MLWTIIVILLVLWLLGAFGSGINSSVPNMGNGVHTLIVIVVILVLLRLIGMV